MVPQSFDAVGIEDLKALVANSVSEGRRLEFKQALPGPKDADLKEFLADVTSLGNASGGDVLFGVRECKGAAVELVGVATLDPDAEILRLESIVRDGVEPRLAGVRSKWLEVESGRGVLFMRIPASFAAPHRIRFKNSGRFFSRNSRGKYELDTNELRDAFTASEELPLRLRRLHEAAVVAASGADMPFTAHPDPIAVVSIIPLDVFRERRNLDLNWKTAVAPPRSSGLTWRITLEGLLQHSPQTADNTVRTYALTHRSGRVDAAWVIGGAREVEGETVRLIWPKYFEEGVTATAAETITRMAQFGVEGPWALFVTVTGLLGHWISLGYGERSEPAWRNAASLPEAIADQFSQEALLPIFQSFWHLLGVERPDTSTAV